MMTEVSIHTYVCMCCHIHMYMYTNRLYLSLELNYKTPYAVIKINIININNLLPEILELGEKYQQ